MKAEPVGGLSARVWRRLERAAQAAHEQEVLATVRGLTGAAEMLVEPSGVGLLRIRSASWQVWLEGTVVPASGHGSPCSLHSAGRYGRWWWVRLLLADGGVAVLGSHLRFSRQGYGGPGGSLDSPAGGGSILVPCEYGSRSATSHG